MFKQLRNHIKRMLHKPKVEESLTAFACMYAEESVCKPVGMILRSCAREYIKIIRSDAKATVNEFLPHHATENASKNRN